MCQDWEGGEQRGEQDQKEREEGATSRHCCIISGLERRWWREDCSLCAGVVFDIMPNREIEVWSVKQQLSFAVCLTLWYWYPICLLILLVQI